MKKVLRVAGGESVNLVNDATGGPTFASATLDDDDDDDSDGDDGGSSRVTPTLARADTRPWDEGPLGTM